MQPRLTRSRTEVVVAGVCGGLAEYFHVDPVIVRMIFVLVTISSGLGLLIYGVLWMVMPLAPETNAPGAGEGHGQAGYLPGQQPLQDPLPHQAVRLRDPAPHTAARYQEPTPPTGQPPLSPYADEPPPPEAYVFDPLTGERIARDQPNTGATVDLSRQAAGLTPADQPAVGPQPPAGQTGTSANRRRISWAGVILVGLGVMLLAEQFGIEPDILFPIILVGVGALLLLRRA